MYVFVSHSSTDYKIAQKVCNLLESNGHECFLAPRDIRTGHEYAQEIIEGIERSEVVLLLLSKESNDSPHVLREIERAISKRITVIVYKLEEVELSKSMEYFLMSHQWVNTTPGVDYKEILSSINKLAEKELPESNDNLQREKQMDSKRKWKKAIMPVLLVFVICIAIIVGVLIGENQETAEVSLGDTIVFGAYNGEPIEWRVLKLSEDGREAIVVSKNILTMKAFDAAESGTYNQYDGEDYWADDIKNEDANLQHLLRGNNQWNTSNIRTWLNSTEENVAYKDRAPAATAMSAFVNGYDTEPGFLSGFSDEELKAIVLTTIETDNVNTEDKVFLISSEELSWFETADINVMAEPTEAAVEQDKSKWYQIYSVDCGVKDYYWWLRDTDENAGEYEAYMMSNSYSGGQVINQGVGLEGFGIRPAMTLDLSAGCIEVK